MILAIVRGARNELFGIMLEIIQSLIAQTPYHLQIDYIDEEEDEIHRAAQLCREKKPLGILFLGGSSRNFQEGFHAIGVPCVLLTNSARSLGFPNLSSVSTDDVRAAQAAVERLLDLGHRQIAVIGGSRDNSDTSGQRYRGCLEAFSRRDLSFDAQRLYREARFSYQGGYGATVSLLEDRQPFTAIFAMADVLAVGAIRALKDRGLQVPEDVSVLGVDGLSLGRYLDPRLSTVCQGVGEMACRGVALLLESLETGPKSRHETIPFTFFPGQSLAPLKG